MNELFSLAGKTALVTGATSGIGRHQALALAQAGAAVVLLGRREAQLQEAVAEIEAVGGKAAALPADLSDRSQLPAIAERAALPFGPIDILINAAGVNFRQPVEEITLESWDMTLNLNLAVPFFLARELVPAMKKRWLGPDHKHRFPAIEPRLSELAWPTARPRAASPS